MLRVVPFQISIGLFTTSVPVDFVPLAAGWLRGRPMMWGQYEHPEDADAPQEMHRSFSVVYDGDPVLVGMEYIDSLYSHDGAQMLHLYGDPL